MRTNLKLSLSTMALFASWPSWAQETAAKVVNAVASGASGVVVNPDGRFPIIVWVVGAAAIGFGVGYAVGSSRANSSSQ